MQKIKADQIRKLRDQTGAPVLRVKKVLEEFNGNENKARDLLTKEGFEKVAKREGRETGQGIIATYLHHNKKVASLVELFSETDFVARNELFGELGKDLAMQVASMKPRNEKELLEQEFIKDPTKKISDLVKVVSAKTGENIRVGKIIRLELGK